MIRVLVADNSRIYTRLLADALRRDPELEIVAWDSDPSDLVSTASAKSVDVVVISSRLDEQPSRGLAVLREIRAARPDLRAVVLLDSSKDEAVLEAFRAGARAVFGRDENIERLSRCVRCVHDGEVWATNHHLDVAITALANSPTVRAVNAEGLSLLSERELQVVRCLAEGLTNREIAERLQLSQHTVKNYLFRVFDKLGVSSRMELLFMTLRQSSAEQTPRQAASDGIADEKEYSRQESDLLRKSAEAGLPAAQLALAQMCLTRRSTPQDLVDAYMWYLVATERALQARDIITKMMTPEQIEEAREKALQWLPRRRPSPATPTESARVRSSEQPKSSAPHDERTYL